MFVSDKQKVIQQEKDNIEKYINKRDKTAK